MPRNTRSQFVAVTALAAVVVALLALHFFFPAPALAQGGTQPDSLAGLELWLKADDGPRSDACDSGNTPTNGASVICWDDQSGNNRDVTPGSAPTYQLGQVNGLPAVEFNGTSNHLRNMAYTWPGTDGITIFAVANASTVDGYQSMVRFQQGTGTYIVYVWSVNSERFITSVDGGTTAGVDHGLDAGEWNIGTGWRERNSSNGMRTYDEGTLYDWDPTTDTALPTGEPLIVGCYDSGSGCSGEFTDGDVAEIIVYDRALSDPERQGVECYLSDKYDIPVSQACDGSPAEAPGGVSGDLDLWLKAGVGVKNDTCDGVDASDGQSVACWEDQSPGGNDVSATSGNEPTYQTASIGGQPSVRFDGLDDLLRSGTVGHESDLDIFLVFSTTNTTQDEYATLLASTDDYTNDSTYQLHVGGPDRGCDGRLAFLGTDDGGSSDQFTACAGAYGVNPSIDGATNDSGTVTTWKNGAPQTSSTPAAGFSGNTEIYKIGINRGDTVNWDGDIAEVIVYSRTLTAGEREDIECYLSDKYDINVIHDCGLSVADLNVESTITGESSPIIAGGAYTFTLHIENGGPAEAQGVTVHDALEGIGGWELVSVTPSGNWFCDGHGISCTRSDDMPVGDEDVATFVIRVPSDATPGSDVLVHHLSATADNPDSDMSNNAADYARNIVRQADLGIEKTLLNDGVAAGGTALFEVVVRNDGPSDAAGVSITDVIGTDPNGIAGAITFSTDASDLHIPAGQSRDLMVAVEVLGSALVGQQFQNCAQVDDIPAGGGSPDHESCAMVTVGEPLPLTTLSIAKSCDATAVPGELFTCTVTMTNTGTAIAYGAGFLDSLYDGAYTVEDWYRGGASNMRGRCDSGLDCIASRPLNPGEVFEMVIVFYILPDSHLLNAGTYPMGNWVDAYALNATNRALADEVPEVEPTADLRVEKVLFNDGVAPGGTALFEVVVFNDGPSDMDGLALTDLPGGALVPGTEVVSPDADDFYLAAGASKSFLVSVPVPSSAVPNVDIISNTVAAVGPGVDYNNGNATTGPTLIVDLSLASASGTVGDYLPATDVSIRPADGAGATDLGVTTVVAGTDYAFELWVANNGLAPAEGVILHHILFGLPGDWQMTDLALNGGDGWYCDVYGITCSRFGAMPVGVEYVGTFTITIPASALGTVTHLPAVTMDNPESNIGNNQQFIPPVQPRETVDVVREGNLRVEKVALTPEVMPGGDAIFQVTIYNDSTADADAVRITETVTSGTLTAVSPAEALAPAGSGLYIPAGGHVDIMVSAEMPPTAYLGDTLTNLAELNLALSSFVDTGADPDDDWDEATVAALAHSDLDLKKTGPWSVEGEGSTVNYTLLVANNGPSVLPSGQLTVTDNLAAAGLNFVSASAGPSPQCDFVDLNLEPPWNNVNDVPSGAVCTIEVTATVASGTCENGLIFNEAQAHDEFGNLAQATWVTTLDCPTTLAISKEVDWGVWRAGEGMNFTITVTNTGPVTAYDVELTDNVSPWQGIRLTNLSIDGAPMGACGDGGFCNLGDIASLDSVTVFATIWIDSDREGYEGWQQACVEADNALDVCATQSGTIIARADLEIHKAVIKDNICLPAYGFYEVVVTNNGPSDAQSVVVTDTLPPGLVYGGGSPECADTGEGVVECTLPTLVAHDSYKFLIGFNMEFEDGTVVDGDVITNTAIVDSATLDWPTDNNTSGDVPFTAVACDLPPVDIDVTNTITDITATIVAGRPYEFEIHVSNVYSNPAEGVIVHDLLVGLPGDWYVTDLVTGTNWTCGSGLTCSRQDPMPAHSDELVATVTIMVPPQTVAGDYDHQLSATADNPDVDPSNNMGVYTYTVTSEATLEIAKSAMPDPVIAGEMLLYQIVVTNTGPSMAWNVALTDTLDAGTAFAGASPGCANTGGSPVVVECALGDLYPDAATSVWIAVRVDDGLPEPSTLNNAFETWADNAPPVSDSIASGVIQSPLNPTDLELSKRVVWSNSGPFHSSMIFTVVGGGFVEYELVVGNSGPTTATNVVVFDQLPFRFEFVSASFVNSFNTEHLQLCQAGVSCSLGDIPVDGTVTVTLRAYVPRDLPWITYGGLGRPWIVTNSAIVQASNPDMAPTNNWDSADVRIAPEVDLVVFKESIPATVVPGEELTYKITVYNTGPSDAQGVARATLFDRLPQALDYSTVVVHSSEGYCAFDSGSGWVACGFDLPGGLLLPEGVELTIRAKVRPDWTEQIDNVVYVQPLTDLPFLPFVPDFEVDYGDNTTSVTTFVAPKADLAIDKVGPMTVTTGSPITYVITIQNNGPSDAYGVAMTDTLPYGVSYTDYSAPGNMECREVDTGVVRCQRADRTRRHPAGRPVVLEIYAEAQDDVCYEGKVNNFVEITSDTPDTDPTNNNDEWGTVLLSEADLWISKEATGPITAGQTVDFVLTVTNTGPGCATDVVVIDNLDTTAGNPAGLEQISFATQSTQTGSPPYGNFWYNCTSGVCDRGAPLLPGETDTITLTVRVPAGTSAGTYRNGATVDTDSVDPGQYSNTTVTRYEVMSVSGLTIEKSVIKDEICLGAYGFYEVVVHNAGPSEALDVVVTDILSDALIYGGGSPECTAAGQVVSCTVDSLAVGESYDFVIGFNIESDVTDGTQIANTATISASNASLEITSAPAVFTATQCFLPETDMQITKVVAQALPAAVIAGDDPLRVTLTVRNDGLHWAEGVVVQDPNPYGDYVDGFSFSYPGWVCDNGVTCVRQQPMPPNVEETISFNLHVAADRLPGTYTNRAYVTADNPDPDSQPGDNLTSVPYLVETDVTLRIRKGDLGTTIVAGGESKQYSIVVWNDGPSAAYDVVVVDTPAAPFFTLDGWLIRGSGPMSCSNATCTIDRLLPGESAEMFASVLAAPNTPPGMFTDANVACITGANNDDFNTPCNGANTEVVAKADLSIEKTGPLTWTVGLDYSYQVTVTNNGPSSVFTATVRDLLPYGVIYLGDNLGAGDICAPGPAGEISCDLTNLPPFNTVDGLLPGATFAFTIYVRAEPDVCYEGKVNNYVYIESTTPDPDVGNNNDDWGTVLLNDANLTIEKVGPNWARAGKVMTFTLTVANNGPSCAMDVTVIDELTSPENAAGLTAVDVFAPGWSCFGGVCQKLDDMLINTSDTITITAFVPEDVDEGDYTNSASVTWDSGSDTDTHDYEVRTRAALRVTKSDVADPVWINTLNAGTTEDIFYIITVWNKGPSMARSVVLTDTMQAGLQLGADGKVIFHSSWADGPAKPGACAGIGTAADPLVCGLGDIPADETLEIYVGARVMPDAAPALCETEVRNDVAIDWEDSDPSPGGRDAHETTLLHCASDLDLKKTGPRLPVPVTVPYTYVLTVTNTGAAPIITGELTLEDEIPAGLVYQDFTPVGNCGFAPVVDTSIVYTNTAPLPAGETCGVVIEVVPTEQLCPAGLVFNEAQVHNALNPAESMDQATWLNLIDCSTALAISKDQRFPEPPVAGEVFEFTILITNTGNVTAYDVELTDIILQPFPSGAEIIDIQAPAAPDIPFGACISGGYCNLGDLPVDDTIEIRATVQIDSGYAGLSLVQEACAEADNAEMECAVWQGTVVSEAELVIEKSDLVSSSVVGGLGLDNTVVWVINVQNNGPSDAWSVVISDVLPASMSWVGDWIVHGTYAGAPAYCSAGDCDLGILPAGETAEIHAVMAVHDPSLCDGPITNVAQVDWQTLGQDLEPVYQTATADEETDLICQGDLDLKKVGPAQIDFMTVPTPTVTYVLTVTNNGPSPIPVGELTLEDRFPAGLNFVAISTTVGTCDFGGTPPSWINGGDLLAGGLCRVEIEFEATEAVCPAGIIFNEAQVHDLDSNIDQAVWLTEVDCTTWLGIDKDIVSTPVAGSFARYDVTITNDGYVTAFGPELTDNVIWPATGARVVETRITSTTFDYDQNRAECTDSGFCNLPDIPVDGEIVVRVAVEIDPDQDTDLTGLALHNRAAVEADNAPMKYANQERHIMSAVTLAIEKDDVREAIVAGGDPELYIITVWNDGPSDAFDVEITDTPWMPYFYLDSDDLTPGNQPMDCENMTCTIPYLGVGQSVEIYAQLYATADAPIGTHEVNTACITAVPTWIEGVSLDPECSVEETDVIVAADLTIDKSGPITVTAGSEFDYTITVHNNGPGDAMTVTVVDMLPYAVSYVDDTDSCVETEPGVLTCDLGDLPAGESISFTLTALADGDACYEGKVNNYVSVSSETYDPYPLNNDDDWGTVILNRTTLVIDKLVAPDPVIAGEWVDFMLVVTNTGPGCATDVTVVDAIGGGNPPGLVMEGYEDNSTQGDGPLDGYWYTCSAGGSCTRAEPMLPGTVDHVILYMLVPASTEVGEYLNWADVIWDSGSATTSESYDVTAVADVGIVKVAPDVVEPWVTFNYEFDVTNYGSSDAQGIVVTDTLDPNVAFEGAGGNASPGCLLQGDGITLICEIETLAAGTTADFFVTVRAEDVSSGTVIVNNIVVSAETEDPNLDNNTDSVESTVVQFITKPSADLGLVKTAEPMVVQAGDYVTFTMVVTNNGPLIATRVVVKDALPPSGFQVISIVADNPDDTAFCDGERECDLGKIFTDTVATVTLVGQVDIDYDLDSMTNLAYVENYGDEYDNHAENDWSQVTILITDTPRADLALVKDATPTVRPGAKIDYTLTVFNDGPADAENILVTDHLPEGVTYLSASDGCLLLPELTVECSAALLPAEDQMVFTITVQTAKELPVGTSLENEAAVESDAIELDPSNNRDTADTSIVTLRRYFLPIIVRDHRTPLADLTAELIIDPDAREFDAGDEVLLRVRVINVGNAGAGPFWVDLYINPDPFPYTREVLWQDTCSMDPCYGIAWQVMGLEPGESVLLWSEPWSYDGKETNWDGTLPLGTTDLSVRANTFNPVGRTSPFGVTAEADWLNNYDSMHGFIIH